ncbi:DinB superfamily protein [Gimesia panareensis]|uniref:DinB superfamily protein n=1 Tax=Gimesia panareensis TaxID=2527978 RepID=A0A518FPC3_9PLAN|nr:DinB family protein [Gimesia panareensis]QDV18115.1 DinB superfamily protein [Gimesia panareensis]
MNTIEFIRSGLDYSKNWTCTLLDDMRDTPFVEPTPRGGNHPLWVLGHLIVNESVLLDEWIQGKPNRFPEYQDLFGYGSTPVADPSKYPAYDAIRPHFDLIRQDTLAYLDQLSEEQLDHPSHYNKDPFYSTIGNCFHALIMHPMSHAGNISDARRAAGKSPLMT